MYLIILFFSCIDFKIPLETSNIPQVRENKEKAVKKKKESSSQPEPSQSTKDVGGAPSKGKSNNKLKKFYITLVL